MVSKLIGGASRIALVAALAGGVAGQAAAADMGVGGDCCADLEERVAELESTAVKHENRKITLLMSGSVTEAIVFWDDGIHQDTNVVMPDSSPGKLDLSGEGRIHGDLTVGYAISLNVRYGDPADNTEHALQDYEPPVSTISVDQQWVSLNSKSLGSLQMGLRNSTYKSYNGAFDNGGDGSAITSYNGGMVDTAAGIGIVESDGAFTGSSWYGALSNFGGDKAMSVRYNSPDWEGFSVSGSWGGDDLWSVGGAFNREWDGTTLSLGAAYENNMTAAPKDENTEKWLIGGSVHHVPSGLFLTLEYDHIEFAVVDSYDHSTVRVDGNNLFLKGGWRRDVTGMGETSLWAEWMRTEGATVASHYAHVEKTEGQGWGLGIAQNISAVGDVHLFLSYQHRDVTENDHLVCPETDHCQALSTVMTGLKVGF